MDELYIRHHLKLRFTITIILNAYLFCLSLNIHMYIIFIITTSNYLYFLTFFHDYILLLCHNTSKLRVSRASSLSKQQTRATHDRMKINDQISQFTVSRPLFRQVWSEMAMFNVFAPL